MYVIGVCIFHCEIVVQCTLLISPLTEAPHNDPQLPTQPNHFQTYTAIYYGHSELSHKEKSKFEFEEKKVQFITENCVFKAETPANFPFLVIN